MSVAAFCAPGGAAADIAYPPQDDSEMLADFVCPQYEPRHLRFASEALRGVVSYGPEANEIFRIAHNWRSSHIYPMTRIRRELSGKVGKFTGGGVTAARLKRMISIRSKLKKEKYSLWSIQDIAGCRAIVSDMSAVMELADRYLNGATRHKVANKRDLISKPRPSGYRSFHIILEYRGGEASKDWNRLSVEVQLRTKLQHAWATAVEAVGLMRGENLKGGEGDPDWLRLFVLMSAEFCAEEGQPLVPGVSDCPNERKGELVALNRKLSALKTLESYNKAIHRVGGFYVDGTERYVVVQFDYRAKTVEVRPFHRSALGDADYINEETSCQDRQTVLVEISKIEDLQEAYPNYFVDVAMFTDRLRGRVSVWDPAWARI